MSQSPSATIVYGVEVDPEIAEELPWNSEEYEGQFDEWYLDQIWEDAPDEAPKGAEKEFYAKRQELVNQCPIDVVEWGSSNWDETYQIIAVRGTALTAYSECKRFEPKYMGGPGYRSGAWNFCEQYDIPFDDPAWLLVPSYG